MLCKLGVRLPRQNARLGEGREADGGDLVKFRMIGQNICHIAVLGDGSLDIRLVQVRRREPAGQADAVDAEEALRKMELRNGPQTLRPDDGLRRRLDLPANEKDLEPPPRQPLGMGKPVRDDLDAGLCDVVDHHSRRRPGVQEEKVILADGLGGILADAPLFLDVELGLRLDGVLDIGKIQVQRRRAAVDLRELAQVSQGVQVPPDGRFRSPQLPCQLRDGDAAVRLQVFQNVLIAFLC